MRYFLPRRKRSNGVTLMETMGVVAFMGVLVSGLLPVIQKSVELSRPVSASAEHVRFLAVVETAFRDAEWESMQLDASGAVSFRLPPSPDPVTLWPPPETRLDLSTNAHCATLTFFRLPRPDGRPERQIGRLLRCK